MKPDERSSLYFIRGYVHICTSRDFILHPLFQHDFARKKRRNGLKVLWTGCLRKGMEEAQKEEREENRGDGSFIQRDVYVQYCGYNTKMEGYTHCRYNTKWELFMQ